MTVATAATDAPPSEDAVALDPTQRSAIKALGRLHKFCEHIEHLELESAVAADAPGAVEVLRQQVHLLAQRHGARLNELVARRFRNQIEQPPSAPDAATATRGLGLEVDPLLGSQQAAGAVTWHDLQTAALTQAMICRTGLWAGSRYSQAVPLAMRAGVLISDFAAVTDTTAPDEFSNSRLGELAVCVIEWATLLGVEFPAERLDA